jgi:transposase
MAQRVEVVLSGVERETLERWARRPKSSQALAHRCRVVLAAAEGRSSKEIAAELGGNANTVGAWRSRFAQRDLDGLHDKPRPGKPRTIPDADVERVLVKTLEEQPTNATLWETRSMAQATGMSQSAVSRIWRAFGLEPHRTEAFKLSPDPQFVDRVRDIVGLYLNPPEAAVVLCVEEKSQIQALDRSAPVLPLLPGVPARQTHDYVRNGTINLYAALDVASGQVLAEMTPRQRAEEFRRSARCRRTSTCTSCATTPRPTRRPRSSAGSSATRASRFISRRRTAPGSTSSSAGSAN